MEREEIPYDRQAKAITAKAFVEPNPGGHRHFALLQRYAGAVIIDRDTHMISFQTTRQGDRRSSMASRIVKQVADDLGKIVDI